MARRPFSVVGGRGGYTRAAFWRQALGVDYYANSGGGETSHEGLIYLQENAKMFYDFTQLSGANGAIITAVPDLSINERDLSNSSPAASPSITKVVNGINEYNAFKAFPSSGSKDVLLSSAVGNDLFKSSFELWCVLNATGNSTVYDFDICGSGESASDYFRAGLISNQWNMQYRYSAGGGKFFYALSSTTYYSAFPLGKTLLRFKMDFENDVCKLWLNGQEISLTFNGTNTIATVNPANFSSGTSKFCVGGRNDAGTITARSFAHNQYAFAVTPIVSSEQAVNVSDYLINKIAA